MLDPPRHPSPDLAATVPPAEAVKVKICGVRTLADALSAAGAGADWIGLNFHPPSPRCIDLDTAASLVAALPSTTQAVGLFVNRPADEVAAVASRVGLHIVQLHGDEPPEDL